jgi:hypothetical protein
VLFTLFSPYLRYYQTIFPTTQSSGWYYRRSGRSMYPSCLKMSSGAGGPSDISETPGTYSSTFAVSPLRLRRSGEIPLVCQSLLIRVSCTLYSATITVFWHPACPCKLWGRMDYPLRYGTTTTAEVGRPYIIHTTIIKM